MSGEMFHYSGQMVSGVQNCNVFDVQGQPEDEE